ncbi:MAG: tetratricopeptide repeat protein [Planctomycetaceae bacterium]|jgi:Tfp pilus assembly protein PilF|nr:tetratricopeptide repeat protein [Planctomycetaceae bacterium]
MQSLQELSESAEKAYLEHHWAEAEELYRRLQDIQPENGKFSAILGEIRCCQNEPEEGILFFLNAVDLLKNHKSEEITYLGKVYFLLALACQNLNQPEETLKAFRLATKYCPDWKEPWLKFGQFLFDQGLSHQAAQCFRQVVALDPNDVSAWLTIGYIEQLRKNHSAAVEAMQAARKLDPDSEIADFYLAESLRKQGNDLDAVPYYRSLITKNPLHYQGLLGYGESLLATGNLEEGWLGYEARQFCTSGTWELHTLPQWNGETDLHGTILAFGEDGVASEVLFSSCLPDLTDQVGHCYVECNRALHTLFKRSFPGISLLEPAKTEIRADELPGLMMDYQVPFGSLPRYFRTRMTDFPRQRGHLISDPVKVRAWQKRLGEKGTPKKIGILWEGTWTTEPELQRQIPFEELSRIIRSPFAKEVCWVSLQHGNHRKEWNRFCAGAPVAIEQFPEIFTQDFDDLASFLVALDMVIAPSGFQAHFAAALGVSTWVVLPKQCDWRWHLSQNYSPWYPSVKLFQQKADEPYSEMIGRLLTVLEEEFRERSDMIVPFPNSATSPTRKSRAA